MNYNRVRKLLKEWYSNNGRKYLSWRRNPSPYNIMLSEFLLKRTKAEMAETVFKSMLNSYHDIYELSKAEQDDLIKVLKPIGLYRQRAEQIKSCAEIIINKYNGVIPKSENELRILPGIGDYSLNAILCFAYGKSLPLVDSNIARIILRLTDVRYSKYEARRSPEIWDIAHKIVGKRSSFADITNWALIDLGAKVCTPVNQDCILCPIKYYCRSFINKIIG